MEKEEDYEPQALRIEDKTSAYGRRVLKLETALRSAAIIPVHYLCVGLAGSGRKEKVMPVKTHLHIGLAIICFWILLDQKDRVLVSYVASHSEDHSEYLREFVANEVVVDGSTAALEPCRLKATSVINRAVRHQIEHPVLKEAPPGCR